MKILSIVGLVTCILSFKFITICTLINRFIYIQYNNSYINTNRIVICTMVTSLNKIRILFTELNKIILSIQFEIKNKKK